MRVSAKDLVIVSVFVSGFGSGGGGAVAKGLFDVEGLLEENGFEAAADEENGFAPDVDFPVPPPPKRKSPAFIVSFFFSSLISSFCGSAFLMEGSGRAAHLTPRNARTVPFFRQQVLRLHAHT